MMYNTNWIDSIRISRLLKKQIVKSVLSVDQIGNISANFKSQFFTPNTFVRIGLFIFTLILSLAAIGIVGMAIGEMLSSEITAGILCIAVSGILFFVSKFFITKRNHYKSGIDDCLCYLAVMFLIGGFTLIIGFESIKLIIFLSFLALAIAAWIYFDAFLALLSFLCSYILIFLLLSMFSWGRLFMPFIFFVISGGMLFFVLKFIKKYPASYHINSLKVLKVAGFICLYASMNYFVVKEGNSLLNSSNSGQIMTKEYLQVQAKIDSNTETMNAYYSDSIPKISEAELNSLQTENESLYSQLYKISDDQIETLKHQPLPLGFIFIVFTAILPFLFIIFALLKRDRLLLWVGLAIIAFSIFTYKYYINIIPLGQSLSIAGLLLLVVATFSIRYLKLNNKFFTYETDPDIEENGLLNAEGLLVAQTFNAGSVAPETGTDFGGGQFGGGGAGG